MQHLSIGTPRLRLWRMLFDNGYRQPRRRLAREARSKSALRKSFQAASRTRSVLQPQTPNLKPRTPGRPSLIVHRPSKIVNYPPPSPPPGRDVSGKGTYSNHQARSCSIAVNRGQSCQNQIASRPIKPSRAKSPFFAPSGMFRRQPIPSKNHQNQLRLF